MYFIISSSLKEKPKYNSFYWGGKYFTDIINSLNINYHSLAEIKNAILYYNKADRKLENALLLNVTSVEAKQNYLKIYFEIAKPIEYKSFHIKDALKKYLNVKSILDLPYLTIVDEIQFLDILNNIKIFSTIKTLEEKNNWQEIYNILQTYQPIEKNIIWNDAALISSFSFATAKLSECSENLKKKFSDKTQRNNFIEEKRKLRELTIKLRKRAIELEPENSSYYSNLAYTYYQSVNELITPGSRRDGDIFEETKLAIEYLNKSLSLNPNRIKDIYRKAMLYSEILGTHKFFKQFDPESNEEKLIDFTKALTESINCFRQVETLYDSFSNNDDLRNNKKIYIKSLYHLAQKYLKLGKLNYNSLNKKTISQSEKENTIEYLLIADNYIDKCIVKDYNRKKTETQIFEMASNNNFICGVYKSYLKAVIQLFLYLIKKEKQYETNAMQYLQLAMETTFPHEMKNQNKIFILDKIATLHLTKENYKAAIKTLEPIYNKYQNLPSFAAYTLTLAYIYDELPNKAEEIINKYIKQSNDLFKYKFEKLHEKLISKKNSDYANLEIKTYIYESYNEEII